MRTRNKGFTLMELMIVVAIIGIIATVALPSFRNHVFKAERTKMQAELHAIALLQERFYTNNSDGEYADDMAKLGFQVPPGSGVTFEAYTVRIDPCVGVNYPDNPGFSLCYILNATAIGEQAEDGDLILDNRGREEHINAGILRQDWNGNNL
jgi:prepilin-type N-terminal cleavage/methylation domain-containing protein